MSINKGELMKALTLVRPGLASKETIEQSTSFVFLPNGVATYNDEVAVFHPISVGIEGAIPGKELYALLGKLKEQDIELYCEGGEIIIKAAGKKAGIKMESTINLPLSEMGQPQDWVELPKEAMDAVDFCLFSASTESTGGVLQCLHMHNDVVESCDNFRLTQYFLTSHFPMPLLIPASSLKHLINYLPNEYALTDGWAHFKNEEGTTFSCRVMAESYPDLTSLLSMAATGEKLKLPPDLGPALDRAGVFTSSGECGKNNKERISFHLTENLLAIRGEGASGWFEELQRIRYKGDEINVDINPDFLASILKHTDEVQLGKLLKFEGDKFVHVVATIAK